MIRRIELSEIEECLAVIHRSFETVAKEFGITQENCPTHTSFMKAERLYKQFNEGRLMYA
jgi:nucleoid-associated protein YejK